LKTKYKTRVAGRRRVPPGISLAGAGKGPTTTRPGAQVSLPNHSARKKNGRTFRISHLEEKKYVER